MQGKRHDGAIAVEVRAFIENFAGFRLKLQRGRGWLGQHFAVRGVDLAFGLGTGGVRKERFLRRHYDGQVRQVRQAARWSMIETDVFRRNSRNCRGRSGDQRPGA
ncbi:MAG: hypothetical protein HRJ53_17725 [Acidobacteria bacterium Pan2503]|uniref:Uncharacterized protein n=1 Tax=Candidatus Acidiferrum panamense TaxID=2741543 RepID=A0A7V8NSQ3_9BACT|nr:hypothetical protein [Candidatus Acidoferrum panamensis]